MNNKSAARSEGEALANRLRLMENQGKPARSVNGVTYSELMKQLRGER